MVAKEERNGPARASASRKGRLAEGATGHGVPGGGNVGNALRSVYDQTVNEVIPDEMLDLLGKLS